MFLYLKKYTNRILPAYYLKSFALINEGYVNVYICSTNSLTLLYINKKTSCLLSRECTGARTYLSINMDALECTFFSLLKKGISFVRQRFITFI